MRKTIRLACMTCDREDFDGITSDQLKQAIRDGWQEVDRVQTYAQSCKTYDDPRKAPPGFSASEWWTHLGTCPSCASVSESQLQVGQ